ncbi:MAG: hypothetical protein H7Z16_13985 [Pyrinomonadaceae bacterium]|nr:hypothetical protein [Pyrinomonadaceae bacterium]
MDEFSQKLVLTLLDKGVLALVALIFGYWISKRLEGYKADQQRISALERDKTVLENELNKQKYTLRIQFKEQQLSSFYWPIFLRFQKDTAMWKMIPQLSRGPKLLPDALAREIELSFLIKNHEEIVSIVESSVYLAQADDALLVDLVAYIKHVAVYKALREAKDYDHNPIDLGEPFPENLVERIEQRLKLLQSEYDSLVQPKSAG